MDTNVFLELLLDQEAAASVQALVTSRAPVDLHISDLAFHSIGIILYQKRQHASSQIMSAISLVL